MKRATVGMIGSIAKVLGAIAPLGSMLSAIATPLTIAALSTPGQAQVPPITQEPGTNTNINPDAGNPNQFNITGGQLSGDNQNLFHSFQQFGLDSGQIANFLSNPNIRNILGRVMGGEPSIINGLIQVTGGQSNLFLMNPAGIIFGADASLNVPASFTATTATSIGFGNNWFNAAGVNNYAALIGSPTSFAFNVNQPGAIINAGNLSVNGGDLTLLGGTVVNTGNVSAPGRQITVAAVEGGKLVQIKQQGMLLSLEVEPLASADTQPGNWALPVQSLPQLLTGGNVDSASGITVNTQAQAVLTGSGIQVDSNTGSVTVAGNLDASNKTSGQAGGTVHVLANKIALVESAQVDVSGDAGGGTALIGGDYQGKGEVPNATQTFVGSNVSINADAISTGNGGKVILWADEATRFYGNISARGGASTGDGGFVEVSGKQNLAFDGSVDVGATAGTGGQLLLDPASVVIGADDTNDNQLDDGQILATDPGDVFFISAVRLLQTLKTGNVSIAATDDITIGSNIIDTSTDPNPNSLTFTAPLINLNASIALKGGNITFDGAVASTRPPNRTLNSISTGGNITFTSSLDSANTGGLILEADGNVSILGLIGRSNPFSFLNIRQANNVELRDLPSSGLRVENVENLNIQVLGDLTISDQNYLSAKGDIQLGAQNIKISNIDIDIYGSNNRNLRTNRDLIVKARENLTIDNTSLEVGRNINLQGQSVTVQGNSNLQTTGNLTVQAQGNLTLADSKLFSLGNLDLLGKRIVDIRDSATNPTIAMTGGNLTIQGDQEVNIQALSRPESVFRSTGNLNLVSNGTITGNARFISDGNFSVLNLAGQPGNFSYTPINSTGIISSNGDVNIGGNYIGASLKVEARGSITGGNITITEPNTSLTGTDTDIAILSNLPSLILRAGLTDLRNNPTISPNNPRTEGGATFTSSAGSPSPGNIKVGTIDVRQSPGGRVILSATGTIETGNISTNAINPFSSSRGWVREKVELNGTVELSTAGNITTGKINTDGQRSTNSFVSLISTGGNIQVESIDTGPGGLDVAAFGLFRVTGVIDDAPLYSTFTGGLVGQVRNIPTSIIARPSDMSDPQNVPITIRHGNGSIVESRFAQTSNVNASRSFVQSGDAPFAIGPRVTGRLFPDSDADFVNGVKNETYRVLNSSEFPANVSGAVGAIVIGAGSDSGFYGSTQNMIFEPRTVTPNPTAPNHTNPPPRTNPVVVIDQGTDKTTPINNTVAIADTTTSTNSTSTSSSTPDTSNSTTTQTGNSPTELEKKTQSDTSTTSSSVFSYTGKIFNVSLEEDTTSCHATELRVREDGKVELIGSCLSTENEEPKKLSEVNLFEGNFAHLLFPTFQFKSQQFMENLPEKMPAIGNQRF